MINILSRWGRKLKCTGTEKLFVLFTKIFEKENEKQGMRSETYSKTTKNLVCPAYGQLAIFLLPYRVNII